MSITYTLSKYLARAYFVNTMILLSALLGLIFIFDTAEMLRRAGHLGGLPMTLLLKMSLLKLPEVGQLLVPFAILFSAMFTFWKLNRSSELIVLRSSGFSVWQFLLPVLLVASLMGVFQVTVINPMGAVLLGKFDQMERKYLDRQDNQIAIFQEGLWLRQSTDGLVLDGSDDTERGYVILNARKVQAPDWVLKDVTLFYFGANDIFKMRLDASSARLVKGAWVFENPSTHKQGGMKIEHAKLTLPTTLTRQEIEESFSSAQSIAFWSLPAHIQTLEQTGFDASRLRVYYYSLLSQPLFFIAMVLLAATVSIRPPRIGGTFMLFVMGIGIGFVVFFMSSYLQALGASQQIPPALAAWAPAGVCFLLGLTVILNMEDG